MIYRPAAVEEGVFEVAAQSRRVRRRWPEPRASSLHRFALVGEDVGRGGGFQDSLSRLLRRPGALQSRKTGFQRRNISWTMALTGPALHQEARGAFESFQPSFGAVGLPYRHGFDWREHAALCAIRAAAANLSRMYLMPPRCYVRVQPIVSFGHHLKIG